MESQRVYNNTSFFLGQESLCPSNPLFSSFILPSLIIICAAAGLQHLCPGYILLHEKARLPPLRSVCGHHTWVPDESKKKEKKRREVTQMSIHASRPSLLFLAPVHHRRGSPLTLSFKIESPPVQIHPDEVHFHASQPPSIAHCFLHSRPEISSQTDGLPFTHRIKLDHHEATTAT